jgi:hypothetical protein
MSLAVPVAANYMYDFGDRTATELGTAVSALETKINAGRVAAVSLINSGAYGSTSARYRVIMRQDANAAAGYVVQITLSV